MAKQVAVTKGDSPSNKDEMNAKEKRVSLFQTNYSVILFKGQHLIRVHEPFTHWETLTKDLFDRAFYDIFGGVSVSTVNDAYSMVRAKAPIADHLAQFIAMGDLVWDMKKLEFTEEITAHDCIFASPYAPDKDTAYLSEEFIYQLANDRAEVAGDIWQSLAPLITWKKPTGVIWYKGRGRNGKSGILESTEGFLSKLFPDCLANVTLKQIEDERDTPNLNGKLANIVDESNDGIIEDSRNYKALGTHQSFLVHKFHTQDMIKVDGNLHHIFSTNNMPTFSDKSDGARRRTLIISFDRQFDLDETFYERTFTEDFLNGFLWNLINWAKRLRDNKYVYTFSDTTSEAKAEYDKVVNTAETFSNWLIDEMGVQYFENFNKLRFAYDWWCDNNGYTALGKTHLRNAVTEFGFKRSSMRKDDGKTVQIFLLKDGTTQHTDELFPGVFRLTAGAKDATEKITLQQTEIGKDFQ